MSDTSVKFETVRLENDKILLGRLAPIRSGEDIKTLESFARAYLGMFYEIDKALDGKEKLALLANDELCAAVLQGFVAVLQRNDIPAPGQIGIQLSEGRFSPLGYIVLAGMDHVTVTNSAMAESHPTQLLQSALCFHYSHATAHKDIWLDELLKDAAVAIPALSAFWLSLLQRRSQLLPGLYDIVDHAERADISAGLLIPVMQQWTYCNKKIFKMLLFAALCNTDHDALLDLAKEQLGNDNLDDMKKLYWHAVVFFLAADDYGQALAGYCGRIKQKVLPLLDFSMSMLKTDAGARLSVHAMHLAWLLRIIAPIFPPQQHAYGSYGSLDVNSQNVMYLFYQMAIREGADFEDAIKWLKKARVMKIYTDVINQVMVLRDGMQSGTPLPAFDEFVASLKTENKLTGRSNRFRSTPS